MYTPHEIRSVIKRCNTFGELKRVEDHLAIDGPLYSDTINQVFTVAIDKRKKYLRSLLIIKFTADALFHFLKSRRTL